MLYIAVTSMLMIVGIASEVISEPTGVCVIFAYCSSSRFIVPV